MTITFTDAVLDDIDKTLATVPPERGGALLAAGGVIHFLLEDKAGSYTSTSWDISSWMTPLVQAAESAGRGRFRATVHTHPAGVPDPSGQDVRATARVLEENSHLDEIVICIVTVGRPRAADLPIGETHRMSIHLARRAPGGSCRVARVTARVVPVAHDLRELGLDVHDARAIDWEGTTYLALDASTHTKPLSGAAPPGVVPTRRASRRGDRR